jgi:hypothetical protein
MVTRQLARDRLARPSHRAEHKRHTIDESQPEQDATRH